jgi:hypothetical protein
MRKFCAARNAAEMSGLPDNEQMIRAKQACWLEFFATDEL